MKKQVISLASALIAGAAISATTTLDSATLGIVTYDATSETETIIGVPWLDNGSTNQNVTVANLVANPSNGDQISVWNENDASYDVWQYNGTSWVGAIDAKAPTATIKDATATTIARGQAVWYKPANTMTLSLLGITDTTTITTPTTPGTTTSVKYNLLANPYKETYTLSNITGVSEGDEIMTLDGNKTLYVYKSGKWNREVTETHYNPRNPLQSSQDTYLTPIEDASTISLPIQGFWYMSHGGAPTIRW